MSTYTYVVDHGEESPAVNAGMVLNGGKLQAVQFADALSKLDALEELLLDIQATTECEKTEQQINEFLAGN